MKNILFIILLVSLLSAGCDYAKKEVTKKVIKTMQPKEQPKLDESEKYHAVVNETMTLAEVADTNGVAISFLKQKLGIPHYVDHPYTILQLSRNYQFSVDDLKRIIGKYKDDKKIRAGKSAANKEK